MDIAWKSALWSQFGAAIESLEDALLACPDELWSERLWGDPPQRSEYSEYWYVAYHTLFWLDLYLSGTAEGFAPPAPFNLDEMDPAGLLPDRRYSRDELMTYLNHGRSKGRAIIESLTDERARERCKFGWGEVSYLELLLDLMRHVQEHAAQLNLLLGQQAGSGTRWVSKAKSQLGG